MGGPTKRYTFILHAHTIFVILLDIIFCREYIFSALPSRIDIDIDLGNIMKTLPRLGIEPETRQSEVGYTYQLHQCVLLSFI